jgi:KWG Leptospira.
MKKNLLPLLAALMAGVCYGQSPGTIPYRMPLTANVTMEYSYRNGSSMKTKKAKVELVLNNFAAHHSPINSFADGGLAGGFKCDIVFSTWFSYSSPTGFTVDNEFVSFDELGIKGINFIVKKARFRWIQGVYGQYEWFDMGSPHLPTHPNGDKPGYTGSIYLQLKEMIGDHGSCAKDIQVVKGKGPIYGNGLEFDEVTFTPPAELKSYLKNKEEKNIQEEKERREREARLYNSSGSSSGGIVLTRSSNSSSDSRSSSGATSSGTRSNTGSTPQRKGSSGNRVSQAWLEKETKRIKNEYSRYRKEPPKQRSIYDDRGPSEEEKRAAEKRPQKQQEEVAKKLDSQRTAIIREFPVTLQNEKTYTIKGGSGFYCFLYVPVNIDYQRYEREGRHVKAKMLTSNVFFIEAVNNQINGAALRKEMNLTVSRQMAKQNNLDERYYVENYVRTPKYIVGPYNSEQHALMALSQFKNKLAGKGVIFYDVQFSYQPKSRSELYNTAIGYFEKKDYRNALHYFEQTALENAHDPALYVYMARCVFKIKPRIGTELNNKIVQYYLKAIQNGAGDEEHFQMGEIYHSFQYNQCRSYDFEAVACYTKAAEAGHQKATEWLRRNSDLADKVLIYYNPSNKKYGISNLQNKVVVNAEYDDIQLFYSSKYIVKKEKQFGIIDKAGNEILPVAYKAIRKGPEGMSLIETINGSGFVNSEGKIIARPEFIDALFFKEGLAAVAMLNKDSFKREYGFIDTSGRLVIPCQYARVASFSEGLAEVQVCDGSGCKWGYINKAGNWVIPPQYRLASRFVNGEARVAKKNRYITIDKTGKKVKK